MTWSWESNNRRYEDGKGYIGFSLTAVKTPNKYEKVSTISSSEIRLRHHDCKPTNGKSGMFDPEMQKFGLKMPNQLYGKYQVW